MHQNAISNYFEGFDLGKDRDFSAIGILAHKIENDGPFDRASYTQPTRHVVELTGLIRIPLGTEYLDVIRRFRDINTKLLSSNPFGYRPPKVHVVVDAAGPGQIAVEMIRQQKLSISIVPTLLTGGTESNRLKGGKVTIPRRELISNARFLLETGALRIAQGLKYGALLEGELAAIRAQGGQSNHDDLAIAVSLAAWHAVKVFPALRRTRLAA
jgi:hypothetical protein